MSNNRGSILVFALAGIALIAISLAVYFYLQIPKTPTTQNPDSKSSISETKKVDETANWKTYKGQTVYTNDGSSMFEITYPPDWILCDKVLYPSGKISSSSIPEQKCPTDPADGYITLGAGGRGEISGTPKVFPAGIANYYWSNTSGGFATFNKNSISYIIESVGLPKRYTSDEYKKVFDQILSTFKFL